MILRLQNCLPNRVSISFVPHTAKDQSRSKNSSFVWFALHTLSQKSNVLLYNIYDGNNRIQGRKGLGVLLLQTFIFTKQPHVSRVEREWA